MVVGIVSQLQKCLPLCPFRPPQVPRVVTVCEDTNLRNLLPVEVTGWFLAQWLLVCTLPRPRPLSPFARWGPLATDWTTQARYIPCSTSFCLSPQHHKKDKTAWVLSVAATPITAQLVVRGPVPCNVLCMVAGAAVADLGEEAQKVKGACVNVDGLVRLSFPTDIHRAMFSNTLPALGG